MVEILQDNYLIETFPTMLVLFCAWLTDQLAQQVLVLAYQCSDEPFSGIYTFDCCLCFVVRHFSKMQTIKRAFTHADDVLATEATPAVLKRHQEAAPVPELSTAVAVGNSQQHRSWNDDKRAPVCQKQLILCRLQTRTKHNCRAGVVKLRSVSHTKH